MKRIENTERIEWKKLLKKEDRLDLLIPCIHYVKSEEEETKEEILKKLKEQYPEKK
jgi:hypothetical protein